VLNGIRGLVLPWVGSVLFVTSGSGAVLAAMLVSLASFPAVLRCLRLSHASESPPVLRVLGPEPPARSAG
jgi:hypothetical protein